MVLTRQGRHGSIARDRLMKRLKKHKQSLETAEMSKGRLRNGHIRDRVDYNAHHLLSRLFLTFFLFLFWMRVG